MALIAPESHQVVGSPRGSSAVRGRPRSPWTLVLGYLALGVLSPLAAQTPETLTVRPSFPPGGPFVGERTVVTLTPSEGGAFDPTQALDVGVTFEEVEPAQIVSATPSLEVAIHPFAARSSIGEHTIELRAPDTGELVAAARLYLVARPPEVQRAEDQSSFEIPTLLVGGPARTIGLRGRYLFGIDSVEAQDLELGSIAHLYDDYIELPATARGGSRDRIALTLFYRGRNDFNAEPEARSVRIELSTTVAEQGAQAFAASPQELYVDEPGVLNVVFTPPSNTTITGAVDSIIGLNWATVVGQSLSDNRLRLSIRLSEETTPGVRGFRVYVGQTSFQAELTLLPVPQVTRIRSITSDALAFAPGNGGITPRIVVEGADLRERTEVVLLEDPDTAFIKLDVGRDRSATRRSYRLRFTRVDSIPFRGYTFAVQHPLRSGGDGMHTHETDVRMVVREPRRAVSVANFVEFDIGSDFVSPRPDELLRIPSDDELVVHLDGSRIRRSAGTQNLRMVARLFATDGTEVQSVEYRNENDGDLIAKVRSPERVYERGITSVRWNVSQAFGGNFRAWRRVTLEIYHQADSYDSPDSELDPLIQEFVVWGGKLERFSSTFTLPPALFVFGERRNQSDTENIWKGQILPINLGYGLRLTSRRSNGSRGRWTIGAYFLGLNFAGSQDTDVTVTIPEESDGGEPTVVVAPTDPPVVSSGQYGLMALSEFFFFNETQSLELPLQFGAGYVLGEGAGWFGVLGFGINFNLFDSP